MTELTNLHPVDELAAIRAQIKDLSAREDALRALLLKDDADLEGAMWIAGIAESRRETLDKAALTAELGAEVLKPFVKTVLVRSVKLLPRKKE